MLATESAVAAAEEEACSRGELVGLNRGVAPICRLWPRQNIGVGGGRGCSRRGSWHHWCCREGGSLRLG
jgi:hypothetical protein